MKKTLLLIAALLTGFNSMAQETYKPTAENLKAREQFQDEKFGIFLHWGLYSMIGAGEWVMTNWNINHREYPKLAKTFYPSEFDADAWVSAIKAAGAKYITITTRHHDGFSLFKTATSTYNTVDGTPFKRDIIKELAQLCLSTSGQHQCRGDIVCPLGIEGLSIDLKIETPPPAIRFSNQFYRAQSYSEGEAITRLLGSLRVIEQKLCRVEIRLTHPIGPPELGVGKCMANVGRVTPCTSGEVSRVLIDSFPRNVLQTIAQCALTPSYNDPLG